jgi:hypothetical protein
MHYIGEIRKQKLKRYCIVGYNPMSERAEYFLKIPESKADLLIRFVRFEPDDPEGYDCYKVQYSKVVKILDLLGHDSEPPKGLEYFVEPWVSQEHTSKTRIPLEENKSKGPEASGA